MICGFIVESNYSNPYKFIGGLAGYILATWCAIRIFGYLLLNAFAQLEVFVNKKKD